MKKWVWDLSYRIGFEHIDKQHKQLFSIANELLVQDHPLGYEKQIKITLQKIKEYIETHFTDEEIIMNKHNYPRLAEHKQRHNDIVNEMKKTMIKSNNMKDLHSNLDELLSKWIKVHILIEDMHFSRWAKTNKII